MAVTIAVLRAMVASGASAADIVAAVEPLFEAVAHRREKVRQNTRKWRDDHRDDHTRKAEQKQRACDDHCDDHREKAELNQRARHDFSADKRIRRKVSPITPSKEEQENVLVLEFIKNSSTRTRSNDFDRFWEAYPKREGPNPKKPAQQSFERASKKIDPELIIRAVSAYAIAEASNVGTRFIAQASTWLNQERWQQYQGEADNRAELLAEYHRLQQMEGTDGDGKANGHEFSQGPGDAEQLRQEGRILRDEDQEMGGELAFPVARPTETRHR